jgi:hypothetical protein
MNTTFFKATIIIATFIIGTVLISIESVPPFRGLARVIFTNYIVPKNKSFSRGRGRKMRGTLVGDNEGGSSADGDGCENDWILKSSSCSKCCSHQCGSEIYCGLLKLASLKRPPWLEPFNDLENRGSS